MADIEIGTSSDDAARIDSEAPKVANTTPAREPPLVYQLLAEFIGTFLIIVIGLSSVNALILAKGAIVGNLHVGLMFALGIAWGVYAAAPISGGHINPAITVAVAVLRRQTFPLWKVPLYWVAQFAGGFVGAGLNYALYLPRILDFEAKEEIVRGTPASKQTFAMFGGVFPFTGEWDETLISPGHAFFAEAFGAAVICFLVFMLLDERNSSFKAKDLGPVLIALSAAALITSFGAITGGCYNPARDGGPRLFAAAAGWGRQAYPGHQNGFWVYLLGPILGAVVGGAAYDFGLAKAYG